MSAQGRLTTASARKAGIQNRNRKSTSIYSAENRQMTSKLFVICLILSLTGPSARHQHDQRSKEHEGVVGTSGQANARYTAADGIWKLAASSLCHRRRRGVSCTMRGWPTSSPLSCMCPADLGEQQKLAVSLRMPSTPGSYPSKMLSRPSKDMLSLLLRCMHRFFLVCRQARKKQ